jgi:hypothetical protein
MKKLLIVVPFLALFIGVTSVCDTGDDFFIVTKVQNGQITIKDSKGKLKTLPTGSPGLKVGDKVKVLENRVCSWDWGNKPSQDLKPPLGQRNLPFDDGSKSTGDDFFIVTKVQNDQITIKDRKGKLKTLPTGSPGLKVGDTVKVVENRVCSWDWGNKPSQDSKPPVGQRNLPFDDGSKPPR